MQFARMFALEKGVVSQEYFLYLKKPQRISGTKIPQNAAGERIRYCGSPLKYSFSEARHTKSVTIAELREKGSLSVRTIPLIPLRDMIEICGTYDEVVCREFYRTLDTNSYVHITLTNENDIPEAVSKLRIVYPNLMKLDYDNNRTRATASLDLP